MSSAGSASGPEGLSRSNSKGKTSHPLLGSPPTNALLSSSTSSNEGFLTANAAPGQAKYAVYQAGTKRRPSATQHAVSSSTTTTTTSSTAAGAATGLTGSASSPATVSPHLEPTSPASATPPLISRASNSRLPATLTSATNRPKARSISEAKILLQGQNLKADVQALGLSTESAGWAMVQKLQRMADEPMFASVVAAAQSDKVTLCLPAEKLLYQSQLTPAFFLDHLVLLEPVPESAQERPLIRGFATLTGFRGTMASESLRLSSCGTALFSNLTGLSSSASSIAAVDFTSPHLQAALSGAACPTPVPLASSSSTPYPTVDILSPVTHLSIPKLDEKRVPPAPTRASSTTSSRIAALFGGKTTPTPSPEPTPTAAESSSTELPPVVVAPADVLSEVAESDTASVTSRASSTLRSDRQIAVQVMAVNKLVKHTELVKQIAKATDVHIRDALKLVDGCESSNDVVDRVCSFASKFVPPPAWTSCIPPPGKPLPSDSFYTRSINEVSDAIQDLFHAVRLDLTRQIRSSGRRKGSDREKEATNATVTNEKDGNAGDEDLESIEERVDQALERVEEVLLTTLYDRLFASSLSNDSAEDEELAMRVDALNDVHLSLEHLGLDFVAIGDDDKISQVLDGIEDLVSAAAVELSRLQDFSVRTPKAKLAVFVNLHRIVVDGLGKLPPIPLKNETSETTKTQDEIEMDEASPREASRPLSPAEPAARDKSDELATSMHEATTGSVFDTAAKDGGRNRSQSSSSADLILPILIYIVVRHNPARLKSHLLFVQRFRAESLMRGEASYCATNIHAVTEFLKHVELATLGLTPAKLMSLPSEQHSNEALSSRPASLLQPDRASIASSQQFDSFVESANRQIVNVVDSSYRILFGIKGFAPKTIDDVKSVLDGAGNVANKARGSLLRRQTSPAHFGALAAQTATRSRSGTSLFNETRPNAEREMTDLSPPPSVAPSIAQMDREDDTKSVRSISSMLRDNTITRTIGERIEGFQHAREQDDGKVSLGERFASLPVIGRLGGNNTTGGQGTASGTSTPQRTSVLNAFGSPSASPPRTRAVLDAHHAPIQRFLDCRDAGDLRLSEIEQLLQDYKRLARIAMQQ